MKALAFALTLLAPLAFAEPADRWVQATSLMLRKEASATAPIVGRLQQGSRVRLVTPAVGGGDWCMVETAQGLSFAACRYLSEQPVALPRAGEGDVPADRRWVGGSNLLLRAEPRPDAAVLGRLALNTPLRQTGDDTGNGYCAVQRIDGDAAKGYTACRYLQPSPLVLDRLSSPDLDGVGNPDFDPARAFWIAPSWELMAHYASRLRGRRAEQGDAAPTGPDAQLERMKARLTGQTVDSREPAPVWQAWDDVRAEARKPATPEQASGLATDLGLWGGDFDAGQPGGKPTRVAAVVRALPAPPAAAESLWRSDAELAGPGESIAALATRFGGRVRWHAEARPLDDFNPGARTESLTLPLRRISLMGNQAVRDERVQPRVVNQEWDPTVDVNCPGWVGGFAHGDANDATYQGIDRKALTGPPTLFRFWSARPLPAGPARWTRQSFKLDRDATGFTGGEFRTVDLNGDGVADLAWYQLTGLGPGDILGRPQHDDAWYRLLLANVAGRWRLLATDQFSYGCGC
jgi:hypothetical protein